jgi:very-short-patch-repair endonuclease
MCRVGIDKFPEEAAEYKKRYKTYQKKLKTYSEENIKKRTFSTGTAEEILNKICIGIFNYKVEKEKILEPYIVDFMIQFQQIKFGIEIDGGIHDKQLDYDDNRDQVISTKYNIPIIRFKNEDVNTEYFINSIWDICYKILELRINQINIIAEKYGIKTHKLPLVMEI